MSKNKQDDDFNHQWVNPVFLENDSEFISYETIAMEEDEELIEFNSSSDDELSLKNEELRNKYSFIKKNKVKKKNVEKLEEDPYISE
jgi:hypothetical protein